MDRFKVSELVKSSRCRKVRRRDHNTAQIETGNMKDTWEQEALSSGHRPFFQTITEGKNRDTGRRMDDGRSAPPTDMTTRGGKWRGRLRRRAGTGTSGMYEYIICNFRSNDIHPQLEGGIHRQAEQRRPFSQWGLECVLFGWSQSLWLPGHRYAVGSGQQQRASQVFA